MKLIEPGDRVLVDKHGTLFEAIVLEKIDLSARSTGGIRFEPCKKWVTYRTASAREVVRRLDPPAGKRRRPRTREGAERVAAC